MPAIVAGARLLQQGLAPVNADFLDGHAASSVTGPVIMSAKSLLENPGSLRWSARLVLTGSRTC